MATIDVIPIPSRDRQFLIQLFPVSPASDEIAFGRYYESICEIVLKDGITTSLECIVTWPGLRDIVGARITDMQWIGLKTDLIHAQLSGTTVRVAQLGRELSEEEAKAWWS